MNLQNYQFRPDYNKTDNDIAEEFYLPAMRSSSRYDRISGYFGSTIYIIAWSALREFVEHNGKMRLICSPLLSDDDKHAMSEGYLARENEVIQDALTREMKELFANDDLDKPSRVLACLVSEEILEVRIAVPQTGADPDLKRLFHDKVGIFTDNENNSVGFRGSMNETYKGLADDGNLESIDVFPSWEDPRDAMRICGAKDYFERVWNGTEDNVLAYKFPDALRKKLIEKSNGYDWKQLTEEISASINLPQKWRSDKKNFGKTPRPHQILALENWVKNGRKGILEHATGSGKTYTAICAIRDALDRHKSVLVLVPSRELLYQWRDEINENIRDITLEFLLCGDGNNHWKENGILQIWTRPSDNLNKIAIATMDTACTDQFVNSISSGNHLLLIADEVHRAGSTSRRNIFNIDAGERLGLSATPIRYGDPEGTSAIFDYFGGIVKPVYSLENAIRDHVLTGYYYYPQMVHLIPEEQDKWNQLTKEINRLLSSVGSDKSIHLIIRDNPRIQMKLIERARVVKHAAAKVGLALSVIRKEFRNGQKWIVYCDNQKQLGEVLDLLLKHGYDAYEYHSAMNGDRGQTLKYFAMHGGILVSIKCLDEGVDIPSTTHALILASSKNPREFIQRRGRILRKFPGKHFAVLYDAIVAPEQSMDEEDKSLSIIGGELSRAIQFGKWAENKTCVSDLKIIANEYGIDYESLDNGGFEDDGGETESE